MGDFSNDPNSVDLYGNPDFPTTPGAPPADTPSGPDFQALLDAIANQDITIEEAQQQLSGFSNTLGSQGSTLGGIARQYRDIAGGDDPRFDAFRTSQLDLLQSQQNQQVAGSDEQFARRGLGGGSAASNQAARISQDFGLQAQAMSSNIGLQQMGRQDQALANQAGVVGQQAGLTSQQAGLTEMGVGLGQTGVQNQTIAPGLEIFQQIADQAGLGGGGGGGGLSVICTEIYQRGDMPDEMYEADALYGKRVHPDVLAGYHFWAKPLVRLMQRKEWVYRIVRPVALIWARDMAYRMRAASTPDYAGKMLGMVGEGACRLLGKVIRWRRMWRGWSVYNPEQRG